jgi:hypothetical protein
MAREDAPTMTRSNWLFAAALIVWLGGQAAVRGADAPLYSASRQAVTTSGPCCCPDDYCRKPLPCVPCGPLQWLCDDYCRKPLPCVACPCTGCCPDDYCRKPCPDLCRPLDRQYYRCGPPDSPVTTTCPPARCLWR